MLGNAKGRQAIDQESVYTLLEDWEFHHNLVRKTVQDTDGTEYILTDSTLRVWPFTAIGATTEPGVLSQPLLRRFLLQIELEPYSEDEIARILLGAGRRLGWPLSDEAASILSRYSRRNPGMGNSLIAHARARASMRNETSISADIATEVVQRLALHPRGLNDTDLRILMALYDRSPKGIGMGELCRAVGISQSQFTQLVEPYLRLLNLMETQSRRIIRVEGIQYLADIGKISAERAEITIRKRTAA
jgi:Holliday junction DNA helicase RuvB